MATTATASYLPAFAMVVGLACSLETGYAHHSIAGAYDSSRQVTLEGVVTEFRFINPHPILLIDVEDEDGERAGWQLEMDNRRELTQIGMRAETLKPGDRVVVAGILSRDEPRRLYIRRLDRPADGFSYEQVGSRPRIRGRTQSR